jgi:hypothetical protein
LTSDLSAARNQLEDEDDKGDYQKQVDESAERHVRNEPQDPQDQQEDNQTPQHQPPPQGWPATLACRLTLYAARMSLQQREGRSELVILLIGARGQSGSLGDEPVSPGRVEAR